jgi:predicted O-methyltransferase YrrM
MDVKARLQETLHSGRAIFGEVLDRRWNNDPFGTTPRGYPDEYLKLFEITRAKNLPEVDAIERSTGYAIDRGWLDELALHTQIVKKSSELTYAHGRLLYSLLRKRIQTAKRIVALETGTARGFSALCMAKAIDDAGVEGFVVSVDVLPHLKRMYWNCIDDAQGKKTRAELLSPWSDLLERVIFVQGDTRSVLPKLAFHKIHFAFLDAQHIESSVMQEFACVEALQEAGDVVVFDDVTPQLFPGVVAAVNRIETQGNYDVVRLFASDQRSYAWSTKK